MTHFRPFAPRSARPNFCRSFSFRIWPGFGVTRIQNWRRIAFNESEFDIVFTAEDSGESYVWKTLVHKEPDGTWVIA